MTVYELELTQDEIIEDVEDTDLEVEADEVLEVPVAVPMEWDHNLLKSRDSADCHPLSAITGADALKEKLDGIEEGAQANIIETVAVNDVPMTVTDKLVNIAVPTSYGWTLGLDEAGTIYLKDKAGGVLSKIETGLDRVVKSGYFDEDKVEIVLVLDDDSEIRISASSLVDIYTADGYYLTVSKARVFDLTDNIKKVLSDSTAHNANKANPHEVTKAQVGLGNVDNTADLKKPISEATQAALDLKADADDVTLHVSRTDNPHNVTKAQVGLGNVDNTADLAKPVSVAQQAALDLKAEKDTTEAHIASTSNPHNVTKAQVGLGSADDTSDKDKPISTATQAALDKKADATALTTHTTSTSNPHKVTKAQVGLGNADDTSDADKPVSTAQQAALDLKADLTALNAHKSDASNPHGVTKAQVGLGNADNTSDLNKPISTATQKALDGKVDKADGMGLSSNDYTDAEKTKLAGIATGAQVNVIEKVTVNGTERTVSSKTVDIPVPTKTSDITNDSGYITNAVADLVNYYTKSTTYTRTEVNSLIAGVAWTTKVADALPSTGEERTIYFIPKEGDSSDAHDEYIWVDGAWELIGSTQVTVSVVNSSDGITVADQALQTATAAHPGLMTVAQVNALGAKADASALTAHTGRTDNPHSVTKAQIGLGNVDNTSDKDKPISTATQTALDAKADATALSAHTSDKANPHGVTKAQVGLSDVDNTSDADKPISTATQEALDLKADATALAGYVPTTRKVNGKPLSADVALTYEDVGALSADTYIPEGSVVDPDFSTTSTNPVQNKIITAKIAELATSADLASHTGNKSNPHGVTASQIGLGSVDNTSDADKPISTATQKALDAKASTSALSSHTGDTSNPHNVTKAQIGLGNVENTADADKPISTATQTALNAKASTADLTAHTGRTDNPHGVTKAQVGLGNVDNTSDASKPISAATQTALDAKVDKVTGKGLSTNDFTDDLNAKLTALYTKSEIDALVSGVAWSTQVVDTLPTTGQAQTLYFVPKTGDGSDTHDEYIWVDNAWELIGSTQVTIDPATSTNDGLMTQQHVQKLEATATGLATAQSDISSIQTEQTTQNTRLSNLDTSVGNKVDKVSGKGLSTNDFTDALLTKLNGIASGAQVNVLESVKVNGTAQAISSKAVDLTLTKSTVGLGNVDNTSDASKPISTATQTALNAKAGFYRGTFSGNGSTTAFTLTHGLGAIPHVQIYKGSSLVITDLECTTTTVKITFNTAPASGTSYTVVAIG